MIFGRRSANVSTSLIVLSVLTGPGLAQVGEPDCSRALIPRIEQLDSREVVNLSVAWNLSEAAYNKAKQEMGLNVVIKGVPVGANYGEFKSNIRKRAEALKLDRFEQRSLSYLTSSLSPESRDAYKACLAALSGMSLVVETIGKAHYIVSLKHVHGVNQSRPLSGRLASSTNLKPDIERRLRDEFRRMRFGTVEREFTIVPTDLKAESSLAGC